MTERIDHAAKAREVLAEIEQMDPQTQWVEMTQKQLVVTANIGLASVEQQRIANLIALATMPEAGTLETAAAHALLIPAGNGRDRPTIRPEIREGLGL